MRENGQILVTLLTTPQIYQVDPFEIQAPILVHTFPNATSLLGIVETYPDIFYVVVGNWSTVKLSSTPGSYSVWKIEMSCFLLDQGYVPAVVTKVADLPDAMFLNGMTVLDKESGLLLIADSEAGVVWRLNVYTKEVTQIIDDPLMKATSVPSLGINGVKVRSGYLYFTNSNQALLARVPINTDGTAASEASVVTANAMADDFQFDARGDVFIAQNPVNELAFVEAEGGPETVLVGDPDSLILAGPTAVQFGRTALDFESLYITSTGGLAAYISRNFTVGGRVSRVDVGIEGFWI